VRDRARGLNPGSQIQNPKWLPLTLFVLGVGADDPHHTLAADDLAVFTNPPDAGSYLHDWQPLLLAGKPANRLF
jgi:hypothetical protein